MIGVETTGDDTTSKALRKMVEQDFYRSFRDYGQAGVAALSRATPTDTGDTANSWDYTITSDRNGYSITWFNTNVNRGFPVAIMLQYGHGTGTGGYVQGRDYINPAIQPIFDQIEIDFWRKVTG